MRRTRLQLVFDLAGQKHLKRHEDFYNAAREIGYPPDECWDIMFEVAALRAAIASFARPE